MACAAALPAGVAATDEAIRVVRDRAAPSLERRLCGLHPDPATPPPKLA
jgi:hypothetical protein